MIPIQYIFVSHLVSMFSHVQSMLYTAMALQTDTKWFATSYI